MELNSAGDKVPGKIYPGLDYGLSLVVNIIDSRNRQMDKYFACNERQMLAPGGQDSDMLARGDSSQIEYRKALLDSDVHTVNRSFGELESELTKMFEEFKSELRETWSMFRQELLDKIDSIWTRAVGKATEDESQNDVDFIIHGYRPNVGLQADIGPVLLKRKTVVSECIQQAGPVEEKFMRAYEMLKFVLKERSLVVRTDVGKKRKIVFWYAVGLTIPDSYPANVKRDFLMSKIDAFVRGMLESADEFGWRKVKDPQFYVKEDVLDCRKWVLSLAWIGLKTQRV